MGAATIQQSATGSTGRVPVLLVEDNDAHAELVLRIITRNPAVAAQRVADGAAAIDYVFRRQPYADPERFPTPRLILLDLRLPKIDGLEVLRTLKASEELRRIPVVVLTTSEQGHDIRTAYGHHVNSYLVKPLDFDRFRQLLETLDRYWVEFNKDTAGADA